MSGEDGSDNDSFAGGDGDSFMYGETPNSRGGGKKHGNDEDDYFMSDFIDTYESHEKGDGAGASANAGDNDDDETLDDANDTSVETLMTRLNEEVQSSGMYRKPTPLYSAMARRERMKEMQGHVRVINPTLVGGSGKKYEVRIKSVDGEILSNGYTRVIADEHGCYIQFERSHLAEKWKTVSKLVILPSRTRLADEYGWTPLAANGTPLFYAGDNWNTEGASTSNDGSDGTMVNTPIPAAAVAIATTTATSTQHIDPYFIGPTFAPNGKIIPPYRDRTPEGKYTLEHFIYSVPPPSRKIEKISAKKVAMQKVASAKGQKTMLDFVKKSPATAPVSGKKSTVKDEPSSASGNRPGYTKHKNFSRGCFYVNVSNVYVIEL